MEQVILVRYGELALKGKNRIQFEDTLRHHIVESLREFPGAKVTKTHGRFFVHNVPKDAVHKLSKISGIVALNPSLHVESNLDVITEAAVNLAKEASSAIKQEPKTFKVETRRADKTFPVKSPDISRIVGEAILKGVEHLSVDVHTPTFTVNVEIRNTGTYIYWDEIRGPGGLPLGSSGKGLVLLSGGIDSPVAAYLAMKRGVATDLLHFWSYPITSERARDKVIRLAKELKEYNPTQTLYIAHFTDIQTAIMEKCPEKLRVTVMRRMMMRIASSLAKSIGAKAIFTGESLGQVASQTIESITAIEDAATLPVLRPLICFDKSDTVSLARKIGTYDISCLPYEDCCSVFVPRHPATKPTIVEAKEAEKDLPIDDLVAECLSNIQLISGS